MRPAAWDTDRNPFASRMPAPGSLQLVLRQYHLTALGNHNAISGHNISDCFGNAVASRACG
jgi:hypothetical protein